MVGISRPFPPLCIGEHEEDFNEIIRLGLLVWMGSDTRYLNFLQPFEGLGQGASMKQERHIITMLVENEPGVTARVSGLFASRGYNIETICGAPTANPKMSRITITTKSNPEQLEQIFKQLRRLINVIKVRDMSGKEAVKRELALICVNAEPQNRQEILRIVDTFRGTIVDTGTTHYIIEVTGGQEKIEGIIRLLEPMGIRKLARSGILALYREPN
jgi:acetolactate synthase I/III small subunit